MKSYLGVGYYAIQHPKFNAKKALKVFDGVNRPALSFVWGTFGTKTSGLKQWFKQVRNRPHMLEIHMMNQVCVRNGNCREGEVFPGLSAKDFNAKLRANDPKTIAKIQERAREIKNFVETQKNENSKLVLSVGLEDNFDKLAAQNLVEAVREVWPYEIARNPAEMPGTDLSSAGAAFREFHNPNPKFAPGEDGIVNLDGTDIDFVNRDPSLKKFLSPQKVKEYLKNNVGKRFAVFLWSALHQGLKKTSAAAPPPRSRTPEVSAADVKEMRQWLLDAQKGN